MLSSLARRFYSLSPAVLVSSFPAVIVLALMSSRVLLTATDKLCRPLSTQYLSRVPLLVINLGASLVCCLDPLSAQNRVPVPRLSVLFLESLVLTMYIRALLDHCSGLLCILRNTISPSPRPSLVVPL